jgi:hypothetical protein
MRQWAALADKLDRGWPMLNLKRSEVNMYAVTMQCEIPEERTLTLKLPDSIQPGTHEVMVIVDEAEARSSRAAGGGLMRFAGAIPSLVGVEGLAAQRAMREEWQ